MHAIYRRMAKRMAKWEWARPLIKNVIRIWHILSVVQNKSTVTFRLYCVTSHICTVRRPYNKVNSLEFLTLGLVHTWKHARGEWDRDLQTQSVCNCRWAVFLTLGHAYVLLFVQLKIEFCRADPKRVHKTKTIHTHTHSFIYIPHTACM